jgi:iron complex transport system substrate-binding protein
MVSKAGGDDALGRAGQPSFKVSAQEIAESNADLILVMLCGYDAARNAAEFKRTQVPRGWNNLPALRDHQIFAVDANGYFSRPGPRLADGLQLLAHLIHPELYGCELPQNVYQKLRHASHASGATS